MLIIICCEMLVRSRCTKNFAAHFKILGSQKGEMFTINGRSTRCVKMEVNGAPRFGIIWKNAIFFCKKRHGQTAERLPRRKPPSRPLENQGAATVVMGLTGFVNGMKTKEPQFTSSNPYSDGTDRICERDENPQKPSGPIRQKQGWD
ncbi:MAG: hypothetical protein PHI97_21050 [Desulfobulbus sp.]|nr:hypothetical protein [Desulfobulbus sp.]